MQKLFIVFVVLIGTLPLAAQTPPTTQKREPALLQNYITFSATAPPAVLGLDPFYKKYADAHGIPIVSSEKVPDAAVQPLWFPVRLSSVP